MSEQSKPVQPSVHAHVALARHEPCAEHGTPPTAPGHALIAQSVPAPPGARVTLVNLKVEQHGFVTPDGEAAAGKAAAGKGAAASGPRDWRAAPEDDDASDEDGGGASDADDD